MFSVKAKPTPTMPAYTMPSRTPSSSARRHHSSRKRNRPLLASSVTGATTASEHVVGEAGTNSPPTPCRPAIAMAVATKAPHSSAVDEQPRGSGS